MSNNLVTSLAPPKLYCVKRLAIFGLQRGEIPLFTSKGCLSFKCTYSKKMNRPSPPPSGGHCHKKGHRDVEDREPVSKFSFFRLSHKKNFFVRFDNAKMRTKKRCWDQNFAFHVPNDEVQLSFNKTKPWFMHQRVTFKEAMAINNLFRQKFECLCHKERPIPEHFRLRSTI